MKANQGSRPQDAPSIAAAFERVAAAQPDRDAIVGLGKPWTYRELDERSSAIAASIGEFGPAREARVGLELSRGPWSIAGVLGILKAGCAYLPLDPRYPRVRRDFLLENSGCELVLGPADPGSGDTAPTVRSRSSAAGDGGEPTAAGGAEGVPLGRGDLAYIIYTSGSTGEPKGVAVEHGQVLTLVASLSRHLDGLRIAIGRQYQFFNVTFDATIWEIFLTLLNGRELFIDEQGPTTRDPDDLLDLLDQHEVDCLMTTPSFLARATPRDRPALRTIIVCGEPCPSALAERWAVGHRILNGYGPTETTCVVTVGEFRRGEESVAIGPPLEHVRVGIVDDQGRQVEPGQVGEIRLGGPSVARGYFGRPDLTRAAFDDTGEGVPGGGRAYRSGDLGYQRPDGALEFVGRVDDQVKIRGFRVEPAEIEARLDELDWVSSAAVVPFGDQSSRSLAAFLVVSGEGSVEGARAHLRAALPAYMVPLLIELRSALPVLSSGKTDRKRLAEEAAARVEGSSSVDTGVLTGEDLGGEVAAVWAESLGIEAVAPGDDFFELGGHSAVAARVVRRVEAGLGQRVSLRLLFLNPTLGGFVEALEELGEAADPTLFVPVRSDDGRYSIWSAGTEIPAGWRQVGEPDTHDACLDFISRTWEDPVLGARSGVEVGRR